MDDNEVRRERPTRDEYRSQFGIDDTVRRTNGRSKKSNDTATRLAVVQIVICLAAIGLLFAVKKLSPTSFEGIRNGYLAIMNENMDSGEVWAKVKQAANFFFEPAGVLAEDEDTTRTDDTLGKGSSEINLESYSMSFSPYYTTVKACMPVNGRISSPFGRREDPFTGELSLHSGLDIAAAQGTPIAAAFYGTVTKVGEDSVAGKYIRLTHAGGLETFYCHCSEIVAPLNAVIRQGETVALVGETGMATGPHVHFEVRINGLKYDPSRLNFGEVNEL